MRTNKRIRTVLYGDQRLTSAELEVLHTPAMQRLYGLRQLGFTDRIFIDASHARIHHVVGVLHQVDKLVGAIEHSLRRSNRELRIGAEGRSRSYQSKKLADFVRDRKCVVRFIGLLHDLTHAPYGHTIEDEIRLVDTKHDHPERQAEAFYRLVCQLIAWLCLEGFGPDSSLLPISLKPFLGQNISGSLPSPSEVGGAARDLLSQIEKSKAEKCLRLSPKYIAEMFAHLGCAMNALLHLQVLHEPTPKDEDFPSETEYEFQAAIRLALQGTEFANLIEEFTFDPQRDAFMLDIVGNTVCGDLLDYARRDSLFSGLRLDIDSDRIAENFTLVSVDAAAYELNHHHVSGVHEVNAQGRAKRKSPFEGWCLRAAISLVSHKYRTDIPSELMNLLNVRFYLYERVIFHPTKCAAGSMLGTALQLLGWRKRDAREKPMLPAHLRFVGDDVFLHDICSALDFLIGTISDLHNDATIDNQFIESLAKLDRVHSGLAPAMATLHLGEPKNALIVELTAAKLLLNRLMARRYFRPVFRALPSTKDTTLQAGADALADLFRNPDIRYRAERTIESRAGLPLGTVAIHCPTRNTARKIANVFLTKPDERDDLNEFKEDLVCKLKDIGSLDEEIFGEHEKAVKAVEQMYGSMWRLNVYVAPELLERWENIARVAGRVIFEQVDIHGHFIDQPDREWLNDPNLELELSGKLGASIGDTSGKADAKSFGEYLALVGNELLGSERLKNISPELFDPEDGISLEAKERIVNALVEALTEERSSVPSPINEAKPRNDQVLTVIRTYVTRLRKADVEFFKREYSGRLDGLSPNGFDGLMRDVESAASASIKIDETEVEHKGFKFREFLELLDQLLLRYGAKGESQDLFGGVEE